MIKKIGIFVAILIATFMGIFLLALFGPENPEGPLRKFIIDPIPPELRIVNFKSSRGPAGSVRAYELYLENHLSGNILTKGNQLAEASIDDINSFKGEFPYIRKRDVGEFAGFKYCRYQKGIHSVKVLIKEPVAYLIISR